jgi:Tol biopolymer transport system component
LGAAVAGAVVCAGALEAQAALQLTLVSRTSTGAPANGTSTVYLSGNTLSADGSVAVFSSRAPNMPQGDGSTYQTYVRDIPSGTTSIASVDNQGVAATDATFSPAISPSGSLVAFHGTGTGLPRANGNSQVWVHDMTTGKTRLVSAGPNGGPGNDLSLYPSFSPDGRYVAFESSASNLPGGNGSDIFVYVRDLEVGKTILASKAANGSPASAFIGGEALSSNGRFVVFHSNDPGLPPATIYDHVYRRNLQTGSILLIDKAANGEVADMNSENPSITPDGRFVSFNSFGTNLPGGRPEHQQCYVRDVQARKTILVSRNNAGVPQNGGCSNPNMSADGRYVTFFARATNLPGGDGVTDEVYVRDLSLGTTTLLSKAANSDPADDDSRYPWISADGRWVEFASGANNLGGNPAFTQVFRAGPIG